MATYTKELKDSTIKKMLNGSKSILELSIELGITNKTLYRWRKEYLGEGALVSNNSKKSTSYSAEQKLIIVSETMALNSFKLSEYCRIKGLYPEQITQWKEAALLGYSSDVDIKKTQAETRKLDQQKIKLLESELRRKDKALAETASLLVLSKKCQAIWGQPEEDL